MEFIKKNYEKILLGAVLFGLVVAVAFSSYLVEKDRQAQQDRSTEIFRHHVDQLPPPDLSRVTNLLNRAESPITLDFSTTNKLFNPVTWQKTVDGHLMKLQRGEELKNLEITKITPLYTVMSFDSVSVLNSGLLYVIGVEQQAAASPTRRARKAIYASLNEKKEMFTLRAVEGPQDNPASLTLELSDSGERVSIAKDKPFKRADGYMADLKYEPEKRIFLSRRVGSTIAFGGEEYIIVAINQDEVVLSAKSNQKKWTKKYNPAP
jgi:hypothetical protein